MCSYINCVYSSALWPLFVCSVCHFSYYLVLLWAMNEHRETCLSLSCFASDCLHGVSLVPPYSTSTPTIHSLHKAIQSFCFDMYTYNIQAAGWLKEYSCHSPWSFSYPEQAVGPPLQNVDFIKWMEETKRQNEEKGWQDQKEMRQQNQKKRRQDKEKRRQNADRRFKDLVSMLATSRQFPHTLPAEETVRTDTTPNPLPSLKAATQTLSPLKPNTM